MLTLVIKFKWFTWPEAFGNGNGGFGEYLISYIFFIFWAVLFGMCSVLLVRVFAPYASGSGIPEVF